MEDKLGELLELNSNNDATLDSSNTPVIFDNSNAPVVLGPKPFGANTDVQNDYTFARQNLYDVLTKGVNALDDLAEIAKQSQHPRAYEVLAGLINTIGQTNERLMNLQKDIQELNEEDDDEDDPSIVVEKAVFVGTTSELLEMTKKKKLSNG